MSLQTALVSQGDEPPSSPLQEGEITRIRSRALEMGLGDEGTTRADATPRERELFDMVLRLTNPDIPTSDASQLVRQAETIAALVHQRDYLSDQLQEERSRWEGEKMGWERVSEALVVQQQALRPADSDLRKRCDNLEFDNKSLKSLLDRSQSRIAAIEHELDKLKPNLLMQYFVPKYQASAEASTSSLPPQQQPSPPVDSPPPATAAKPPTLHALAQASTYLSALTYPAPQMVAINLSRRKKMTANLKKTLQSSNAEPSDSLSTAALPFPTPPPSARTVLHVQTEPDGYFRNTRSHSRLKNRSQPYPTPAISDARAEHLLIAARRIGRERAGIVAGVMSAMELEKERERDQRNGGEGAGGSAGQSYYRESISAPVRGKANKGKEKEKSGAGGEKSTPDRKGKGKAKNVPTLGLDSLVNAALDANEGLSTGAGMMTRRRTASSSANLNSEEPAPKRRRVSGPGPSTRVRSALDVLADQASVVSSSSGSGGKSNVTSDEMLALVPKRKPGRPRKIQSQAAVVPAPPPVPATPMEGVKVGEALGSNGATTVNGAETLANRPDETTRPAVPPKKKRGRPRKEAAPPLVVSQSQEEAVKDKRSPAPAQLETGRLIAQTLRVVSQPALGEEARRSPAPAPLEAETLVVETPQVMSQEAKLSPAPVPVETEAVVAETPQLASKSATGEETQRSPLEAENFIVETPQSVSQPADSERPIVLAEPATALDSMEDLECLEDVDADGEPDPDIDMDAIAVL